MNYSFAKNILRPDLERKKGQRAPTDGLDCIEHHHFRSDKNTCILYSELLCFLAFAAPQTLKTAREVRTPRDLFDQR